MKPMKPKLIYRIFVYFLSVSFLLMMNGFHGMIAGAKEKALPVGEMVSKGTVKFETRENVWKDVESSHFPIFQGVKIKTEKGMAALSLSNGCQIEVSPNSLFFFDQEDRFHLSAGSIEFRIPSASQLQFKTGSFSVSKSPIRQASKSSLTALPRDEETIGSITIHSNGATTVKAAQGKLSILNENQVVVAGLSSKDSVTLPSTAVKTSPRIMTAQAGETTAPTTTTTGEFLGLSTWTWVGFTLGAVVLGVVIAVAVSGDGDHDRVPICP